MKYATSVMALALLAGCESDPLMRMQAQDNYRVYEPSELFADGRAMRTPPPGTVSREHLKYDPALFQTRTGPQEFTTRIPVRITRELLAASRKRYEIICATCHGLTGDGNSLVGQNMALRPPPSLLTGVPAGFIFEAITSGYGLMPRYAHDVPVEERWGIAAYIEALRRSQQSTVAQLTDAERQQLLGGQTP